MVLDAQKRTEILERLDVTIDQGLTTDEASRRREQVGHFNTVDPPIQCPAWICCLLPCIKHIPSMKAYRQMQPEDAEVLRDGRWIRYDASSLVRGDILRLEEGDVVPGDGMVLQLEDGCDEVVVDHRLIQGGRSPSTNPTQIYYGEQLVVGACLAVCTATGTETRMARLIQQKKFPSDSSPVQEEDEEAGISLIERSGRELS